MKNIFTILFCVILNSIAQIALKLGMSNISISKNPSIFSMDMIQSLVFNRYVIIGWALYGISFVIWLYVLSKVKLSYAYPFISLSYVIVAVLGYLILDEKISTGAWIGIGLVVVGVSLIGMNIGN